MYFVLFRNLYYWSSDWKYRNDVDTIGPILTFKATKKNSSNETLSGLRYGCTFTGFTSTGFTGNKMTLTAGTTDRSD